MGCSSPVGAGLSVVVTGLVEAVVASSDVLTCVACGVNCTGFCVTVGAATTFGAGADPSRGAPTAISQRCPGWPCAGFIFGEGPVETLCWAVGFIRGLPCAVLLAAAAEESE